MDDTKKLVKKAISHFRHGVSYDFFSEPVTTYAMLAIEALKKQEAKKPYWETYGGWHCESCGAGVFSNESFCPLCGQALDWKEGD